MNLAGIQQLFTHDGPFVNLHLDVSRDNDAAGKGVETRWTNVLHDLTQAGVDASLLDRIGEKVLEPTGLPGPVRRTVVASGDQIVFDDLRMGRGAWPEVSAVGPLPDVSGWVTQVDGEFPFVLVVADRTGADVDVYRSLSEREHQHTTVEGQTLHINRVSSGDLTEMQNHTEEVWRRNARSVGDSVHSAVKEYGAKLVLLAGEVRARAEIQEVLAGSGNFELVEIESGGRAAGSSDEALWNEVNTAVGQQWAQDRQQVRERLTEREGQDRAVARGLRDVLAALIRGQVERLVVDLDAAHEQTVDPSDYPGLLLPKSAFSGERLHADQVLIAAGATTDANLSLLPADRVGADGVAALLRWDEQSA